MSKRPCDDKTGGGVGGGVEVVVGGGAGGGGFVGCVVGVGEVVPAGGAITVFPPSSLHATTVAGNAAAARVARRWAMRA
jgi:hypothetical protein